MAVLLAGGAIVESPVRCSVNDKEWPSWVKVPESDARWADSVPLKRWSVPALCASCSPTNPPSNDLRYRGSKSTRQRGKHAAVN